MKPKFIQRFLNLLTLAICIASLNACNQNNLNDESQTSQLQALWRSQDTLAVSQSLQSQAAILGQTVAENNDMVRLANLSSALVTRSSAEQIYDIVIMGDCELNMRGITYNLLSQKMNKIAGIGTTYTSLRYNDGSSVKKPELAFMAGDLTDDRASDSDWSSLKKIMNVFSQNGIYFFPITGNHDWDPQYFGDKSNGYTLSGHLSNIRSINGVISCYNTSLQKARSKGAINNFSNIDAVRYTNKNSINWLRFQLDLVTAPPDYGFTYKGVDYVLISNFLYQPSARVTLASFFGKGSAEFSQGIGASYLADRSKRITTPQRIFIQHYPYATEDRWWDNYYSKKSASALRSDFVSALKSAKVTAMFSGHNHCFSTHKIGAFNDYSVGYTGGNGSFYMVRISSTRGILQIKEFDTSDF